MIDLDTIEFTSKVLKDKSRRLEARLVLAAEMHMSPSLGNVPQEAELEAYIKEGLVRALLHTVYGDIKEYMYLMQTYTHQVSPDPRCHADPELVQKIDALEVKFQQLLR
jgi:hypothetical protein